MSQSEFTARRPEDGDGCGERLRHFLVGTADREKLENLINHDGLHFLVSPFQGASNRKHPEAGNSVIQPKAYAVAVVMR